MAGSKEGGLIAAAKNKARYGEDYYAKIGAMGGAFKNKKKGFGSNRALARIAGAKGGQVSRRGKSVMFNKSTVTPRQVAGI